MKRPILKAIAGRDFEVYKNRQSPSLNTTVIQLESPATFGDSGGPVLDSGNRLVGMVSGGPGANIVWIVPVSQIDPKLNQRNWIQYDPESDTMKKLAALGPQGLFGFSTPFPNATAASKLIGRWYPITTEFCQDGFGTLASRSGFVDISLKDDGSLKIGGRFRIDVKINQMSDEAPPPSDSLFRASGQQFRLEGEVIDATNERLTSVTKWADLEGSFASGYWKLGDWLDIEDLNLERYAKLELIQRKDGFLRIHYPNRDDLLLERTPAKEIAEPQSENPSKGVEVGLRFVSSQSLSGSVYVDNRLVKSIVVETGSGAQMIIAVSPGKHLCRLEGSLSPVQQYRGVTFIQSGDTRFKAKGSFTVKKDSEFDVQMAGTDFWGNPVLKFAERR